MDQPNTNTLSETSETLSEDVNNLNRGSGAQIIALGDSITAGFGIGPEAAYPNLLSQTLDLPIVNQGRSGDTTEAALNRLQQDVIAADPWLVIVGLGGNDYLRQVPPSQTEANLRQIVTRLQQVGAIVVILGMDISPFSSNYEGLYQRVANDTQAHLIPGVLEGLNDPRYLYDQIHPNQAGQRILANRIAEGLQPLLRDATLPPHLSNQRQN
ncbi:MULTISPECIES: GDSL-type esterase/lipase family protein [Cyanophyceae]|uniref:GDSL-type esterase/lipase family protein n=1 Tax=Cyanophyceae TaxID=3028117 RepID=UPI001686F19D|nr:MULTISPECIES: GDSL-type esterase/lipase family protein [Cyanophyceae]MBD1917600.1 arylesterase [Phormidium sp. FACHB-77]MBD2029524.1 arylesterase [Phormidium sp. FACHB-322]MBD2050785.1 arylesterase [Leptolyngbya sp. FACHB-60]